jgi:hypothetical protein
VIQTSCAAETLAGIAERGVRHGHAVYLPADGAHAHGQGATHSHRHSHRRRRPA